jgi:hypothetical protein
MRKLFNMDPQPRHAPLFRLPGEPRFSHTAVTSRMRKGSTSSD